MALKGMVTASFQGHAISIHQYPVYHIVFPNSEPLQAILSLQKVFNVMAKKHFQSPALPGKRQAGQNINIPS